MPSEKIERNIRHSVLKNTPHKKHKSKSAGKNFKIIYDNRDVTPKPLPRIDKCQPSSTDNISTLGFYTSESPTSMSLTSAGGQFTGDLGIQSTGSVIKHLENVSDEFEQLFSDPNIDSIQEEQIFIEKPEEMPTTLNIILTETPVFYILQLPSLTAEVGTEEGNKVEQDNTYYEYLTVGKGRNRKTMNAEIQTASNLLKSRYTVPEKQYHTHNYAFASNWDMYDSYENVTISLSAVGSQTSKIKSVITQDAVSSIDPLKEKEMEKLMEKQMIELLTNEKFQTSLTVMERVLANNNFHVQQKRFRGLIEQDPFRPDIDFKYRLELLWTFKNTKTEGQPVTCLQWNPKNSDVLAVGYGKFFYAENKNGFIFCWNIKNPTQPEREHYFTSSVTSLAFSNYEPNLLAVGLYDGTVNVLDISSKTVKLIFTSTRNESPCHEPIWDIVWFPPDDYNSEEEQLICGSQDGRVIYFKNTKNRDLSFVPMMRVTRLEGKAKGIYYNKSCPAHEIPVSKYPGALVLENHPVHKNIYYIGTEEGSVHKCSRNYLHQHMEVFMAHNGPIYDINFSPFSKKIFLTCGADWVINIWTENIKEPLITLIKSMETIDGAVWNPTNATIIANIAGSDIYLWDIQRKTYFPASVHRSPTNSRNTVIQFTRSGRNLVVSDIEGNVNIFSLEDMPFPPFYQEEMLEHVIQKNLITRPHLAKEMQKFKGINTTKSDDNT